jgi:hypothetical protein
MQNINQLFITEHTKEAVSKRQSLILYFQAANFRSGMATW